MRHTKVVDLVSRHRRRVVLGSLWTSLLIHLLVLAAANPGREEVEEKVLAAPVERLRDAERLIGPRPVDLPQVQMERLRLEAYRVEVPEEIMAVAEVDRPAIELLREYARQFDERVFRGAEDGVAVSEEVLRVLAELALDDSAHAEVLDLLRIRDMAHARDARAAVLIDPEDPRNTSGFVNFTMLYLYGAGSYSSPGHALADLAYYMRHYTGVYARIRQQVSHKVFLSKDLLNDPILFLFEGGGVPNPQRNVLTKFNAEERALLGQYLRGGGFLYVEGGNRFLREMIDHVEGGLGGEGRIYRLPLSHPVYRSFYTYGDGIIGEHKRNMKEVDWPGDDWHYPVRLENDGWYPEGLWGAEVEGVLVAVLSDIGLLGHWQVSEIAEDPFDEGPIKSPQLAVATNIVIYALTRPGGLTEKRSWPLWARATGVSQVGVAYP